MGYCTVLSKSGDTSYVENILKITGPKHYFDAVIVISDVIHGKLNLEIFLNTTQRLNAFGI